MVAVKLYVQIVYKNHHIVDVIIKKIVVRVQIKKIRKRINYKMQFISLYDILK